jgi:hypothetical protein
MGGFGHLLQMDDSTRILIAALIFVGGAACTVIPEDDSDRLDVNHRALLTENGPPANDDENIPDVPSNPSSVARYPSEHQSLQSAIDASNAGGVVFVEAGAHVASATITNKRIFIIGSGVSGTSLAAEPSAVGQNAPPAVLTLGSGAHVVLKDVSLSSTGNALESSDDDDDGTATLRVSNVAITDSAGGIVGRFEKVVAQSLTVGATVRRPISLAQTSLAAFRALTVYGSDPDRNSVVIRNSTRRSGMPCIVRVADSELRNGGKGGLAVLGGECPVYISRTRIVDASVFGIGLFDVASAKLLGVEVLGTKSVDVPVDPGEAPRKRWGDGVLNWGSHVDLADSRVENSERAALSIFGCAETGNAASLTMHNVGLACQGIDLNLESKNLFTGASCGKGSLKVTDTPTLSCTRCDGTSKSCRGESSELAPMELTE